ncbi:MAG: HAD family hydrolase [Bacteroidales bacterium]
MRIKNIIFDLGGILLELYPERTIAEFEHLGISRKIGSKAHSYSDQVFTDFERGKISAEEFIFQIKEISDKTLSKEQIINAWNAMLHDFPQAHVNLLQQLRNQGYNLYLLSNTNELHVNAFESLFYNKFSFDIKTLFDKALYSNEIGHRKPHKETFQAVLHILDILPHDTLMIDDSLANIEGAKAAGLETLYIETNNDILDALRNKDINF